MKSAGKLKITVKDMAIIGMMVAVIEICKVAMGFLPNIELTTFWIILFTLFFGKKIMLVVPVFILIEGTMYGFGLWWVMYIYVWPLLALMVWLCRRQESIWFWSILSAGFGLLFGFFCSIPYVIIGSVEEGLKNGLYTGFTWWVAGIPWDITHCIGNFVLMLVLYHPVRHMMQKVSVYLS